MQALLSYIKQLAFVAYNSEDDAAVVAILNTKSVQHSDNELRSSRWLMVNRTPEEAGLVLGTMKAVAASNPVVDAAYGALNSTGIDLSHPVTQSFIDLLAAAGEWPDELRDWIKEQGVWFTSPAFEALGRDATVEDVAAARAFDVGLIYDKKTAHLSVVVQPSGKVVLNCRILPATADGQLGDVLVTLSSTDAAAAELPADLTNIVASLQAYLGGL